MSVCIISPHLDDAVLSCGIRMQRARAAGNDVVVLNVFSAGAHADAVQAHAGTGPARRAEDKAAIAMLDARVEYLDELDAPDRDPRYKSDIELFHGSFDDVPEEYIQHITQRIEALLLRENIAEAYFPLGAGTHIDHRIVFAASRRIRHPHIRYYEDRPYILWPGMLQARMNQLGCDAGLAAVTPEHMEAAIDDYHYIKHFVPPGAFRNVGLPRYYGDLAAPESWRCRGRAEELAASQEELSRLYDSLACYTSQMPYIYPDRDTFLHDSHAHEKQRSGRGAYIERCWMLDNI